MGVKLSTLLINEGDLAPLGVLFDLLPWVGEFNSLEWVQVEILERMGNILDWMEVSKWVTPVRNVPSALVLWDNFSFWVD